MLNEPDFTNERYGRALAAKSYPETEDVPNLPEVFLRKWVLRLGVGLPDGDAIEIVLRSLETKARQEIGNATGILTFDPAMVTASSIRLSDFHLVLEIVSPSAAAKMGDAPAIATSVILRGVDAHWHVEDLQGVPKRYWFIMR